MMNFRNIRLSILDQSPIRKGANAVQAIKETTELVRLADKLGYTRFWVSEHHNTSSLAGSTPEVLIAHLAGETERIRVGSGGIMLPNHSALKVAENFRMLEAIFPGRIDLGMGRAPGTDRITATTLNPSNRFSEQDFIEQLTDLQHYLHDTAEPGSINERIKAIPQVDTVPSQWLLSSSGQSGIFAAHFGMGFSFAHFINPIGGPEAIKMYRERFKPSEDLKEQEANMAIFVFCSRDEEKIYQHEALMDFRFVQLEKGLGFGPVSYQDIKDTIYSPGELERINYNRKRVVSGTPDNLKPKLDKLLKEYDIDELMAVTITENFEDRISSYELLAEMFL